MNELVVAHFNEDLSWLSSVHNYKICVYTKNPQPNPNFIPLPNMGRESHTYFTHIVRNYHNLPDWVFFTQGRPHDHVGSLIEILFEFPEKIIRSTINVDDGCYFFSNVGPLTSHDDGSPYHTPLLKIKDLWESLFVTERPSTYQFAPGAIFCVSRERIKSRPVEFYKKCLDILETNRTCPWEFERIMQYIFNPKFMSKYDLSHLTQDEKQEVWGPIQDDEALLLYATIKVMRLHNILEIGSQKGYSATNFIKSLDGGVVFTVDSNPLQKIAENHTHIQKGCQELTKQDFNVDSFDLVFFDCHEYNNSMLAYNNLLKDGLITDETLLVLHDTGLHPGGVVHQPTERKMVEDFRKMGYDSVSFHTKEGEKTIKYRHGLTIMSKHKPM